MGHVLLVKRFDRDGGGRREVFARFAFNVLMDNTDDHDKNHSFVRTGAGQWDLSEAYDLLPQTSGAGGRGMPMGRWNAAMRSASGIDGKKRRKSRDNPRIMDGDGPSR